jgi:hypothetical protein
VHRVQKFVEVSTGRIGYAKTAAALSEVSNGAEWKPDPSFDLAVSESSRFAALANHLIPPAGG